MNKKILTALIAVAAAGAANAVTIASSTNGPDSGPLPGQTVIADFEAGAPSNLTGTFMIVQGSSVNQYAAPLGDTTKYLAVLGGNSATLTLTQSYSNLSFYWGSIDAFNTVTFTNAAGQNVRTFTGAQIPGAPDNGAQGDALNNRRVNFNFGTDSVNKITFSSQQNAFELDTVAAGGAVPEPATWAMLLAGMGTVGVSMRRRRTTSVTA